MSPEFDQNTFQKAGCFGRDFVRNDPCLEQDLTSASVTCHLALEP